MTTPSNQSFFQKTSSINSGFTAAELATSNPLSRTWDPPEDTGYVAIANIIQGKCQIYFKGRIINFRPATVDRHSTQYLKAWHYLVVKDDSGAIGVKLMPLGIPADTFSLGQLVSVWATYVGEPSTNQEAVPYVLTCTAVNPGPGTRQFLCIDPETPETRLLYRVPLNSDLGGSVQGLVNLDSFIKTGHDDVCGLRVLVCVRSVGARKRIRPQGRDTEIELQEVVVFDHTASCILSLWETQTKSTASWTPDATILLLTSPKWRPWNRPADSASQAKGSIALDHRTLVEIDPDCADAVWLRNWAKNRTKREAIGVTFPSHLWDVKNAMHGPVRALFTIAEVDEYVRGEPNATFTGKLSLVIIETSMADLWFKKAFCCTECCGVPLFANSHVATCKHCQTRQELTINSRIIGTMIDETGCLEKSKLIWNDQVWMDLFVPGATSTPTTDEPVSEEGSEKPVTSQILTRLPAQGLQSVRQAEDLLQQARVTLTFGWASEVGRLCILGVEW